MRGTWHPSVAEWQRGDRVDQRARRNQLRGICAVEALPDEMLILQAVENHRQSHQSRRRRQPGRPLQSRQSRPQSHHQDHRRQPLPANPLLACQRTLIRSIVLFEQLYGMAYLTRVESPRHRVPRPSLDALWLSFHLLRRRQDYCPLW